VIYATYFVKKKAFRIDSLYVLMKKNASLVVEGNIYYFFVFESLGWKD
jgi:hypothetical protein